MLCTSLVGVWDFLWGSYVGWWASPIGGVFGGLLGWWGVWWELVCFGLVLEFPCLGTGIYGGCGIVCLRLPWGFNPWIVPLRFGAGFPRVEALGGCWILFVVWPCGTGFLGGGGLSWGWILPDFFACFLYLPGSLLCISLWWLLHCIMWDSLADFHIFARGRVL